MLFSSTDTFGTCLTFARNGTSLVIRAPNMEMPVISRAANCKSHQGCQASPQQPIVNYTRNSKPNHRRNQSHRNSNSKKKKKDDLIFQSPHEHQAMARSIEDNVHLLRWVRAFLERTLSERYNRDAFYARPNGMSSNKIHL